MAEKLLIAIGWLTKEEENYFWWSWMMLPAYALVAGWLRSEGLSGEYGWMGADLLLCIGVGIVGVHVFWRNQIDTDGFIILALMSILLACAVFEMGHPGLGSGLVLISILTYAAMWIWYGMPAGVLLTIVPALALADFIDLGIFGILLHGGVLLALIVVKTSFGKDEDNKTTA